MINVRYLWDHLDALIDRSIEQELDVFMDQEINLLEIRNQNQQFHKYLGFYLLVVYFEKHFQIALFESFEKLSD